MIGLLALLSCAPETAAPEFVPLEGPLLARRLSIDLRGVLPTTAELDDVEAHPGHIDDLREEWLADPRFEERLVALYQERWHTALDEFRGTIWDYGLSEDQNYTFNRTVGEEPLRLLAHVVATDGSYAEVVTGDWTMATPLMGEIWPVDYPAGESGWQVARYTDNRPAAGVLAVNGLWWRYISPIFNENRARAAAIFDLLVCSDVLARPVDLTGFSIAEGDAAEAIRTEPACLACHAAIEPVAATLYGFMPADDQSAAEMQTYHPEREPIGPLKLGVEPAWMGQPVSGLEELGAAIAADPRFVDCAVQTAAEGLLRRRTDGGDVVLLRNAREPFVEGGLRLKDTIRAIVESEPYRAGAFTETATAETVDREATSRILVTSQLRSVLAEVAGLTWSMGGYDQLDNDTYGYRVLGGSVDGVSLTSPQRTPGLTWSLTVKRAAEASAALIVDRDLGAGADAELLLGVTDTTTPADAAFSSAIAGAHWRLLAVRASRDDLAALTTLWEAVIAAGGAPSDAWSTVLAVLLRDPAFVSY